MPIDRQRKSNMDLLISDSNVVDNFLDSPFTGQQFGFEDYQPPAPAPDTPFDWGGLVDGIRNYDPFEQNLGYMLKAGRYMQPSNYGERLYDLTDASFEPYMSDEERAQLPLGDPRRDAISSLAIGAADVAAGAAVKAAPRVGREMLAATPDMLNLGYRKMGAPELPFELNMIKGKKGVTAELMGDPDLSLAESLWDMHTRMHGAAPATIRVAGRDVNPEMYAKSIGWDVKDLPQMNEKVLSGQAEETARKQIYNATGWWRGRDGKWRSELTDEIELNPAAVKREGGYLSDFAKYDELISEYPELGSIDVDINRLKDTAFYDRTGGRMGAGKIGLGGARFAPLDEQLAHETTHAVQNWEGFTGGAGLNDPNYWKNAGEVEARMVEKRLPLSMDDRRMQYPWDSMDTPWNEQIVPDWETGVANPIRFGVDEPPSYTALMKELEDVDNLPAKLKRQSGADTPEGLDAQIQQLEKETAAAQIHERGKGSSGTVGKSRDRVGTTGKYIGAPEGMDSPQKLGAMRKDYSDTVKLGVAGRDWYDDSSAWIDSVSPDSILAKQHADSLAVTSAGANVDVNLGFTVKGDVQGATGTPVKTGRFPKNQSALIEEIQAGKNPDLGMKRTPFAENLTVAWNPFVGDRAVHDIWQGRAMGYQGKNGKLFDRGFSPQEHAWMDQQMDVISPRLNEEAAGGFTDWNNLKTQASSWTGEKIKHGDILPEDAAMHYGSYSPKYQAMATHEQVTGKDTGHLTGLIDQSPEVRADFSMDPRSSWMDDRGRDALYSDLGLMVEPDRAGMGYYMGETNPLKVSRPLVSTNPATRDKIVDGEVVLNKKGEPVKETVDKHVDFESRALLDAVEGTRAYVDAQNAGAWHKLIKGNKAGAKSSLSVEMDRALTEPEMRKLAAAAEQEGFFVVDTGQGISIINDPFTELGKKRTGVTLGRELRKKDGLGDVLADAMPADVGEMQRVTADTGYIGYEEAWRAGEGSGEVTQQLFDLFDGYPEVLNRLDSSEALRKKALANLERDIEWAEKIGSPVRKDIQTARRIIAESGLKGLKRALDQGVALPVAVLGLVPLLTQEIEQDGSI